MKCAHPCGEWRYVSVRTVAGSASRLYCERCGSVRAWDGGSMSFVWVDVRVRKVSIRGVLLDGK
jgi:hypothetical protein